MAIGERAFELHDKPDASLWEFRGREAVHTYSSVMCWAACDRLGNAAAKLGLTDRAVEWNARAATIRATIERRAWNHTEGRFAAEPLPTCGRVRRSLFGGDSAYRPHGQAGPVPVAW